MLFLPDTQTANGVAVESDIDEGSGMLPAQLRVHPTLDDPEQEPILLGVGPTASFCPAGGKIRRLNSFVFRLSSLEKEYRYQGTS